MNARLILTVCLLVGGVGAVLAQAKAELIYDRYTSISDRNVFGLRPPPPPPPPAKVEPPPPSVKVQLTGIIALDSRKKTVLQVSAPGKPPESMVLGENEAEGSVEVKSIDVQAGKVKVVVNKTMDLELDFEKDGVKPIMTAAAGALPEAPKVPAAQLFAGAATGTASPIGSNKGNWGEFFNRASAVANKASANSLMPPPVAGHAGVGSPVPGQNFVFGNSPIPTGNQAKWPPEEPVSLEESIIYMEINRALQNNNNNPVNPGNIPMPPLPPTIMSPGQENGGVGIPMPPVPGQF